MKQMMQLMKRYPMSLLAGTCCTAIVLVLSPAGAAQQAVATSSARWAPIPVKPTSAAAKPIAGEDENATSGKDGGGGIKVHGHWVITVKNADGTVAAHRDFQNSLVTSGAQAYGSQVLTALLSGNAIPGPPALALIQNGSGDETTVCTSSPNNCAIFAAPDSLATLYGTIVSVLTVQPGLTGVANFSAPVGVVLSGNFAAPATGSVTFQAVESIFPVCVPTSTSYLVGHNPDGTGSTASNPLFVGSATFDNGNTAPNNCTASYLLQLGHAGTEDIVTPPLTFTFITDSAGKAAPLMLAPSQTITISFTLSFS